MTVRHEIGGYMELERFLGEPYHHDAIALNCGRSCLEYLIELRGIKTIWLPDWLCSSVRGVCRKQGTKVKVYSIGLDMRPVYDFTIENGEYLYLVDYYGQLQTADIEMARKCCADRLIVDEAQGFFRSPWDDVDTLYTCRKFFGVSDGAYLYTKDRSRLGRQLETDESHAHMGFVLGRFERSASEFYEESRVNNSRFAEEPMKLMSPITANLLAGVDYGETMRRREANFSYLLQAFKACNLLDLRMPEGPYAFPLLLDDVSGLRERLAEKGVYVPRLWPDALECAAGDSVAHLYSEKILPLPVDQRYGLSEMEWMSNEVFRLLGGDQD